MLTKKLKVLLAHDCGLRTWFASWPPTAPARPGAHRRGTAPHGARRRQGGRVAGVLRGVDHHHRVSAHPVAHRRRG
jgi:hypothetical protein